MTKQDLLAAIRRDRRVLDDVLAPLSDGALDAPGPRGGWSVKDHLSHIAAWERMIVAHLRDGSDADVAGMDAASYAAATLDALNDSIYRLHRGDTVSEVCEEFAAAHEAIVAFIEEMPGERLEQPYWDDDPSEKPVHAKIAGDTYLHYIEHAGWIGELITEGAKTQ